MRKEITSTVGQVLDLIKQSGYYTTLAMLRTPESESVEELKSLPIDAEIKYYLVDDDEHPTRLYFTGCKWLGFDLDLNFDFGGLSRGFCLGNDDEPSIFAEKLSLREFVPFMINAAYDKDWITETEYNEEMKAFFERTGLKESKIKL